MRIWFSLPFIRRTRIGISVSDREIARAFQTKKERIIATGIHLDKLGDDLDIERYWGEPDADFRNRIQEAAELKQRAIEEAVLDAKSKAIADRWSPWVAFVIWVIILWAIWQVILWLFS